MGSSRFRLQERLASKMIAGASMDEAEQLIAAAPFLRADQRAALWLYAWAFTDGTGQSPTVAPSVTHEFEGS